MDLKKKKKFYRKWGIAAIVKTPCRHLISQGTLFMQDKWTGIRMPKCWVRGTHSRLQSDWFKDRAKMSCRWEVRQLKSWAGWGSKHFLGDEVPWSLLLMPVRVLCFLCSASFCVLSCQTSPQASAVFRFLFVFNSLCVCLFVVVLGLRCCSGFFRVVGEGVVLLLRCVGSSPWRCLVASRGPGAWAP